jgi:methylase of polypeptide subunit release factors
MHILENGFLLTEEYRDPVRAVYFGEDSEFYANMLEIAPGSRCLDLCTGTGIQGLVSLARGAASVDAVDIDPRAVRVGRLNARLNGVADRLRFHQGDMFDPLPAERSYDRITCNPPLLPIPPDVPYPRIGDGGLDGLRFTRVVLEGIDRRLASGGKCLLLGLSTADGVSEIERLCEATCQGPFSYTLYLLARQTLDAYAKLVVSTVQQLYPDQNPLRLNRVIRQAYRDAGAEHIVSYYLSVQRDGAGASSGTYDLTRNNHSQTYWFVGAGP